MSRAAPRPPTSVVVVKLGGSVLTGLPAFERCAEAVRRDLNAAPHERWVVVVSAEQGLTDQLESLARGLNPSPDARTLDLLWSTGELRSVALLTLCLTRAGVRAVGLNVHQSGLFLRRARAAADAVGFSPLALRAALARHRVAVVPGFFARAEGDGLSSLGRGGSDLTAVLLAAGLRARRCELVKDVPGYFTRDPNRHADATPLPRLSYAQALALADAGCDLVQRRAVEAAARCGTPLVVRSLDRGAPSSVVCGRPVEARRRSVPIVQLAAG